MTNSSYYAGRRSFMSADLKRTAHAVRQAVDAKRAEEGERHPRKSRLVHRASIDHDRPGMAPTLEAPHLSPRARHALAWGVKAKGGRR